MLQHIFRIYLIIIIIIYTFLYAFCPSIFFLPCITVTHATTFAVAAEKQNKPSHFDISFFYV